ncbi:spinster family MFS transporter [Parahaliea aestuarii]|uniref:MFS transporter n=1 Tax=Parahaliea aestuarii TaxID=1852021 RepID=A0A5C8ZTI1_9GAMM|nr:MFS transporter [Parahaliea aestuarii]TXS90591.1 MFS transporter [Parahaliea aestuarii]
MARDDNAAAESEEPLGGWRAWYTVGMLLIAYMVAFADRQVITLLVEPIKSDLGINDTQISLLMGFAFSIFYVTMGVPIARLSDRFNRRTIISVGVFFWSLATVSCGFARSFLQLFFGRVAVGVGEAALTPAAYSIIADSFSVKTQGRAIAVYSTGIFLGSGIATIAGSALIAMIGDVASQMPEFLQSFRPWQLVFMIVGAPGLLLALMIRFTVKEPLRRHRLSSNPGGKVSVKALLSFVWERRWSYFPIFIGYSLGGIGFWSYLFWSPELLRRQFGMDIGEAGTAFGVILTVFGTLGVLLGGWACDKAVSMGYRDASLRLAMIFFLLALPAMVATPLVSDKHLALALLSATIFLVSLQQALSPVALQLITPNEMRAQVVSLFLMVASFSSIAFGASSVAIIMDFVFSDSMAIAKSLSIVAGVTMTLAVITLWIGLKGFAVSVKDAERWSQQ